MRHHYRSAALKLGVSGVALLFSAAAIAQPAGAQSGGTAGQPRAGDAGTEGDIIVTAQRRSERLQDVPLSVQVISPLTLERTGADTTQALQNLVPGFNVSDNASGFKPFIRGIGSSAAAAGNENSVSTYLDGVYLASMNAGLLNLASIEAIEVLRGPQGTLFGRNATGGVINVRTRRPQHEFAASASLRLDNYETLIASGYVTTGLGESIAADLAVYYRDQGQGYGINLFTGNEVNRDRNITIRSRWLFNISSADTLILSGDYSEVDASGQVYQPVPGSTVQWGGGNPAVPITTPPFGGAYTFPANGRPWDIDHAIDPRYEQWSWGLSANYEHVFPWATFTSITAYRRMETDQAWNATPIPRNAQYAGWIQPERQFSQEFQLSSAAGSRLTWILGAYYLNAAVRYDPFFISGLALGAIQQQFRMRQSIESPALYGQITVPLDVLGIAGASNTNLTAGLRYTIDTRSIRGNIEVIPQRVPSGPVINPPTIIAVVNPTDAERTYRTFTWRLGIDHHFSSETMGYLTYNRGFKAGSYNTIPPGGPTAMPTNPEYLDAYEVGLRYTSAGSRITASMAAFLYNYTDLQVTIFNQTSAQTVNAARARLYGLNFDIAARLSPHLRVTLAAEILDHKFTSYPNGPILTPLTVAQGGGVVRTFGDLTGRRLPYASDFALTAGVDYRVPTSIGTFDATVNFSYNSGYSFEPSDSVPRPDFIDLSGSVGLTLRSGTRIFLFGRNITNELQPRIVATGGNPGGYLEIQYRPPRTYGIGVSQNF